MTQSLLKSVASNSDGDAVRLAALYDLYAKMSAALAVSDWRQMMRLDRLCMDVLQKSCSRTRQREEVEALVAIRALYQDMIASIEHQLAKLGGQ